MKHKMNLKMEGSLLCNQKQSDLNISQLGDKFVIFHLQSWREFAQEASLHRAFSPTDEPHFDKLEELGGWEERQGNSSSIKIFLHQSSWVYGVKNT